MTRPTRENSASDEIARLTAEFEARGGVVERVPANATAAARLEAEQEEIRKRARRNAAKGHSARYLGERK